MVVMAAWRRQVTTCHELSIFDTTIIIMQQVEQITSNKQIKSHCYQSVNTLF